MRDFTKNVNFCVKMNPEGMVHIIHSESAIKFLPSNHVGVDYRISCKVFTVTFVKELFESLGIPTVIAFIKETDFTENCSLC